ncbi:hypothetical protein BI380_25545 [Delftia tsuruhatensis]|uniref:Uncharacterized protein n=1 Tax=Delftia tsuruhatensis TaxID=180282 RepID=A0ABM6EAE3_9BURK|nr:hypothetical protein BI380_25545 [Delftia tsuruhatensis]
MPEIICHKGNISSFQRNIRTSCSHRNSNSRVGHSGGIIHPVANHCHLGFLLKISYGFDFVFRHQIAPGLIQTNFLSNCIGDFLMITGYHYHPRYTQAPQCLQRLFSTSSRGVE